MAIDVGDALSTGLRDLASDRGVMLVVFFLALAGGRAVLSVVVSRGILGYLVGAPDLGRDATVTRFGGIDALASGVELPLEVGLVALAALWLVTIGLRLVAIRAFASDADRLLPLADVGRSFGRTYVVFAVAMAVTWVLIAVSVIGFLVGALVTAILLTFVHQAVAIDDEGPVEALGTSYEIVSENPIEVVVLLLVTAGLGFALTYPLQFLPVVTETKSLLGPALERIFGQITTVFGIAVMTAAYRQARTDREESAVETA